MLLLRGFRLLAQRFQATIRRASQCLGMFPRSMGSTSLSITIGDLVTLTGRRQNLTDTITTSSYLMAQKCRQRAPASEFLSFETEYLIADNRDLLADMVNTDPRLSHWPVVAAWWKERIKYVGPYGEHTTVVFDRSP